MSKEERAEKPVEASRFGKEAKIGVAVIGLLIIVLGTVVAVRLMGSGSDENVADQKDGNGKPSSGKVDDILKDAKPRHVGMPPPTVVSAKAATSNPPKPADRGFDRWKVSSDETKSKPPVGGAGLSAPPLMPDPPKPPMPDRQSRYALDPPMDRHVSESREGRVINPMREGREINKPGDVAEIEDGGSFRDHSRYGDSSMPAPQPEMPPRTAPSFAGGAERSTPATPTARFGDEDYRRPTPAHHHNELRTRPAANSYSSMSGTRDDGKYEVQPNDSYWAISEKLYGTGAYFKALAEANRGKSGEEDRLQPGSLILAPEMSQLEKSYPDLCPKPSRREAMASQNQSRTMAVSSRGSYRGGRTYTVVEGDTLFNIARYELGKASRWAEIYELNRDVLGKDFNYLTPGTQLTLPGGEKSSEIIAEPNRNTHLR